MNGQTLAFHPFKRKLTKQNLTMVMIVFDCIRIC